MFDNYIYVLKLSSWITWIANIRKIFFSTTIVRFFSKGKNAILRIEGDEQSLDYSFQVKHVLFQVYSLNMSFQLILEMRFSFALNFCNQMLLRTKDFEVIQSVSFPASAIISSFNIVDRIVFSLFVISWFFLNYSSLFRFEDEKIIYKSSFPGLHI